MDIVLVRGAGLGKRELIPKIVERYVKTKKRLFQKVAFFFS